MSASPRQRPSVDWGLGRQGFGWVMIALFVWLFHGPWLTFKHAVDAEDWTSAGASLDRIRQIISINLPLGVIVVLTGASGPFWG
jgi:uncharacterized membrane protein